MSTRDELTKAIDLEIARDENWESHGGYEVLAVGATERIADALIAEGWRKKPSREQIARWVWKRRIGPNGDESFDYLLAREARGREGVPQGIWDEADAVLALMDRGQ